MITMFKLEGTNWICECRPLSQDIVIWEGDRVAKIITGGTGLERMGKADEWMSEHIPEYSEDKMFRIQ